MTGPAGQAATTTAPGEAGHVAQQVSEDRPVAAVVHAAGLMFTGRFGDVGAAQGKPMWPLHVDAPSHLIDALAGPLEDGARLVLIGIVQPEEVAGLTAFLLDPEGGSITGQQLVVCGGASL